MPSRHPLPPPANDNEFFGSVLHVALPLVILALGHTISNLVRTLPAITTDLVAHDLSVSAGDIAAMTGFYHLAFAAGQIPVGIALDRYSVKAVVRILLGIIIVGSVFAALVQGAAGFAITQIILGIGCCGMLLCPLTFAARTTDPGRFALWSAIILAVGNTGMVISASPMAWFIEHYGWRLAYGLPALFALIVLVVVLVTIRPIRSSHPMPATLGLEVREVLKIGASPKLRGVIVLAFVSFAVMIGVRGMWGGPWLMEVKDMARISAGHVLFGLTVMLIFVPMVVGLLERRFGHSYQLLVAGHVLAGIALVLLPAGAAHGILVRVLGVDAFPTSFDITLIVAFGALISVQPLLFALGRASVQPRHAGKALSAVNLAFFVGAAIIQAASAPVNATYGLAGVFVFLGLLSIMGGCGFWLLQEHQSTPAQPNEAIK